MKNLIVIILWFTLSWGTSYNLYAGEKAIVRKNCGGIIEMVLSDGSRCDCVSSGYAVEFEYAYNYKEAIGQSLHYARLLRLKAGIVLILRKSSDMKYVTQLRQDILYFKLPITIGYVNSNGDYVF